MLRDKILYFKKKILEMHPGSRYEIRRRQNERFTGIWLEGFPDDRKKIVENIVELALFSDIDTFIASISIPVLDEDTEEDTMYAAWLSIYELLLKNNK